MCVLERLVVALCAETRPDAVLLEIDTSAWDAPRLAAALRRRQRTLRCVGVHDTMDPEHMKWMSTQVQNGRFLLCPNGSHMSMYDDQVNYFPGLIQFIKDVDG